MKPACAEITPWYVFLPPRWQSRSPQKHNRAERFLILKRQRHTTLIVRGPLDTTWKHTFMPAMLRDDFWSKQKSIWHRNSNHIPTLFILIPISWLVTAPVVVFFFFFLVRWGFQTLKGWLTWWATTLKSVWSEWKYDKNKNSRQQTRLLPHRGFSSCQ